MNRFRKEEISASNAVLDVLPTPFSWSVSRHLLFHQCRRAYFLHYYFAQGGWDPYADPLIRFAWIVKKSTDYREWLELQLEKILRFSFDTLRNVPPIFRLKMLSVRIQARLTVLERDWNENQNSHFDKNRAIRDLKSALISFLNTDICKAITSAQNITLFNKAFKPSFLFGNTELWYNPGLIWREGNTLVSLRIHFQKPDAEFIQAESDMFALSALLHTKTTDTISFFLYPEGENWQEIQYRGDSLRGRKRILGHPTFINNTTRVFIF